MAIQLLSSQGPIAFNRDVQISTQQMQNGWEVLCHDRDKEIVRGMGLTPESATIQAGDNLAARLLHLLRARVAQLSADDLQEKSWLIGLVNIGESSIGLSYATHRWLPGHVVEGRFVPLQDDIDHVELAPGLQPIDCFCFAKIPVNKGGVPTGPVEQLEKIGR